MTKVIKKNGKIEAFNAAKIRKSITSAARESEIPAKRTREVVRDVSKVAISMSRKKKEIRSRDLRARILKKLDAIEPAVSRAWRKYDQTRR